MIPRKYSSEAVVLARRNFSEADRILVLYTKHFGKLSVIAKGVRKLKSRKRSSIEVFSQVKFSAARSKSLDIIIETELIQYWSLIRSNLKKAAVAYFFVETVNKLTHDEEKNVDLYELLISYLHKLSRSKNLKELRNQFTYESLVLLGFWPKGKKMINHDEILENVLEREVNSKRVGKKMLS